MFGFTPTASNQEVEPGTAKVHQRQPVRNVEHSFWLVRKVIAPPTCGFAAGGLCPTRKGSLVRAQQRPQRKDAGHGTPPPRMGAWITLLSSRPTFLPRGRRVGVRPGATPSIRGHRSTAGIDRVRPPNPGGLLPGATSMGVV